MTKRFFFSPKKGLYTTRVPSLMFNLLNSCYKIKVWAACHSKANVWKLRDDRKEYVYSIVGVLEDGKAIDLKVPVGGELGAQRDFIGEEK